MSKFRMCVNVGGEDIHLISDENKSYMRSVAAEVDESIKKTSVDNVGLSKNIIHYLIMMDFCDRARKAESTIESLKAQLNQCVETATESQVLGEKLKKENTYLKKELSRE